MGERPLELPARARRVCFGAFETDLSSGELRKHGLKIKLQDQPFQVLALLLERPGEIVTREELRQKLWPADTFVDFDVGLNTAVKRLRDALGDTAESPRYVETLPRRGYRFIAAVESIPSAPHQDLTVRTERAAEQPQEALPAHRATKVWIVAGALAAILALLAGLNVGGLRQRLLRTSAAGRIRSVAVLPLENVSGDPSQEYFADGMTELLTTDLGKIAGLRVISRTSAMHYKGTRKTLPEIARELNVDAVVEGAVLRSGNRVRITAQLVEASSDREIWAGSYERELRDVLALQDEVVHAIVNQIEIKLTPQEQVRLASARAVNPAAHEAYFKGLYEWNQRTEESLEKSVEYFQQAIALDPTYALAWAGLSNAYFLLGWNGVLPPQAANAKAKEAALKALELDETLAEAHVALAGAMKDSWSVKEKELQRAIALDPNDAAAHQRYGFFLTVMGRFDEAIAEMKRARELDPLSPHTQTSLGWALYHAGRYDEALEQFRQVPESAVLPFSERYRYAADIYERKGMPKEAIAEMLKGLRAQGWMELAATVEQRYRTSGYREAKETLLRGEILELQKRMQSGRAYGKSTTIAADYALLGEKEKALAWLEKAFQEDDRNLAFLKVNPDFETLRSDPRFQDLVRRMGLPP
jgi:TolB-like protein/DNA-binding winged helix-turn-helix (wHTH) protein